jgi:hypothetical protein
VRDDGGRSAIHRRRESNQGGRQDHDAATRHACAPSGGGRVARQLHVRVQERIHDVLLLLELLLLLLELQLLLEQQLLLTVRC